MAKSRERAAKELLQVFDSAFLRALTEPARLDLLRVLMVQGPLDVSTLATHVPQERSVVSRHLKILEAAGIVRIVREGKHRRVAIDGGAFLSQLEFIAARVREHAAVCCPPLVPLRTKA
jgi:DNA-binding transcriptional ArsR family regulator